VQRWFLHIFRPDLHTHLPEVLSLWHTMRQQEHALRYLEAIIRYVTAVGQHVKAEDVRAALDAVTPEGDAMIGTIAQEWIQQGLQQGEQRGLRQGLLAGIRPGLKLKFGLAGAALMPEIAQIEDVVLLQTIGDFIELADTPDQVRAFYQGS
jgi:predicted transposase YdaD